METLQPEQFGFSASRLGRIRPAMQRYVDQGKFPGILTLVARCGQVVHFERAGWMDLAARKPLEFDTIFRIYSMTKPITSVAALMLLEEGALRLVDPVSDYIPSFRGLKVVSRFTPGGYELEDARREVNIHDLFTHTAGLGYGFDENEPFDKLYREGLWQKMDKIQNPTLDDMIALLTALPLAHQPGSAWRYSFSIDVLGKLVEVVSGMPLDRFFQERIFAPLGMVDTAFWVAPEKQARLAANYSPDPKNPGTLLDFDPLEKSEYTRPVTLFSGGGGLVSTAADYLRFCQMLLNGGALDGERLLGRKTVEMMRQNHLPEGVYEDPWKAYGFGLGGNVLVNVSRAPAMASEGIWGWGGAASTKFWIDWKENMIAILMTQVMNNTSPLHLDFHNLVYQAMAE